MFYTNTLPQEENVPYGYMHTETGIVPHPYQAKVAKLYFSLVAEGVPPDSAYSLMEQCNVPKYDAPEVEPDFAKAKNDVLEKWKDWQAQEAEVGFILKNFGE